MAAARGHPGSGGGPALVVSAAGLAGLAARPRLLAAPAGHPLVSRQTGQQLARAELSKAMYHPQPSLIERILNAISRFLQSAQSAVPGGWWTLIALVALLVIVAAAILIWIGPVTRTRSRGPDPLLASARRSARDHRREAERLAAEGNFAAAIVEIVRAIAVDLEERDVLPPRAGRTAGEFAAEAGRALPGQAAELNAAARLFDDVRYGDRPGTADGYRRLRDLDAAVRAARPDVTAAPPWLVTTGAATGPVA